MRGEPPYSVVEASAILKRDRRFVAYLLREYGIGTRRGPKNARLLSEDALDRLRRAIEEHESKPDPDLLASAG